MNIIPLSDLNAMTIGEFVSLLGDLYEHSPWIAETAAAARPFSSVDQLLATLRHIVDTSPAETQLTLIRHHPDLAGKLARSGQLTTNSSREQASLGLDRLNDHDFATFTHLNHSYREKFGFPFIVCARLTTLPQLLTTFTTRLLHSHEQEQLEAIRQIHQIARLRLLDRIGDDIS